MFHTKICSSSAHCQFSLVPASCAMQVRSWAGKDSFTAFSVVLVRTWMFRCAQTAWLVCLGSFCEDQTQPLHPKPLQSSTCQVCWAADFGRNSAYAHPVSEARGTFCHTYLSQKNPKEHFAAFPATAERNKWNQNGNGWIPEVGFPTDVTLHRPQIQMLLTSAPVEEQGASRAAGWDTLSQTSREEQNVLGLAQGPRCTRNKPSSSS